MTASTSTSPEAPQKRARARPLFYKPKFKIPPSGLDPAVRTMFEEMLAQQCTQREMVEKAGFHSRCMQNWLRGNQPYIGNLRAALNALGLDLAVVPLKD